MSMVYDPLTREFRPRESRVPKPQPPEGPELEIHAPPSLPSPEGRKRRSRRWTDLRRHRRRREALAWILFILFAGSLIWVTVWTWGKSRHSSLPSQATQPFDRIIHSITE